MPEPEYSECWEEDHRFLYRAADDLCVLSCFFTGGNPARLRALTRFRASLDRSSVPYLIVECAFETAHFQLAPHPQVLQLRTDAYLFQKERLLNHALSLLPARYTKVAWVDGDVFFENTNWLIQASDMLDRTAVVQLFETAVRLPGESVSSAPLGKTFRSWASVYQIDPELAAIADWDQHGHTGFAWAAQRSLLDAHGLYEACLAGTGDHMMAHAMVLDPSAGCLRRLIGHNSAYWRHFEQWARPFRQSVDARIAAVPGTLLHIWHGPQARYVDRSHYLREFNFDPVRDLAIASNGCLEWTGASQALRRWARAAVVEGGA